MEDVKAPYTTTKQNPQLPPMPNISISKLGFDWHDLLALFCLGAGVAGAAFAMANMTESSNFVAVFSMSTLLAGFGMGRIRN